MDNCLIQTPLFGDAGGLPFDDLAVSNWPTALTLKKITKIRVSYGEILDRLVIDYEGSTTPGVHGKSTGIRQENIPFGQHDYLVGVYGLSGPVSVAYGPTSVYNVQFVILNKETGQVTIKGPYGDSTGSKGTPFYVTNNIVGFSGNTTKDDAYIQSLSFWTNFV
ncbi:hypothetical protein QCA50_003947 [Cerrena zonata]|uniref:Jacalin-type lectin domain-containing protein n=1 Tax=Cerrena zonata TaxID=2478898 RepID=A0AAW0GQR6_9APHY